MIRINKYLASLGIASRRKIDSMILEGMINLNGKVVWELGVKVDPQKDIIKVNGEIVEKTNELVYLLLNKPRGIISTVSDEHKRKTVISLVNSKNRLFPVGRLDQESEGLILLTNDGELTQKLTHPKFHIPKTYLLLIEGNVLDWQIEKIRDGINLKEGPTLPSDVRVLEKGKSTLLEVTIYEGRNRQIRRMCGALDLQLRNLKRVKFGNLEIGNLKSGQHRSLTIEEIESLKNYQSND